MIYSVSFIARPIDSSATSTAAIYTVPAGKVAIVRSIDIVTLAAGTLYVGGEIGGHGVWWETTAGLAALGSRHVNLRQVVPAGGLIRPLWVAGNHTVSVSGYLLTAS